MKLRNLMYATMIACAFASCSKDDEVINGGNTTKGDAKLTISVDMTNVATKADNSDANALPGETTMKTIQVGLFKGNVLVAQSSNSTDVDQTKTFSFTGLPVGVALNCIVLVNMDNLTFGSDGNQVNPGALSNSISAETGFDRTKLPMYGSKTLTALSSGDNGSQTVDVFRNVARVQISKIALDMVNPSVPSGYVSGKATFQLNSVVLANASNKATITGAFAADRFFNNVLGSSANPVLPYYESVNLSNTLSYQFSSNTTPAQMNGLVDATSKVPTYCYYVFPNTNQADTTTLIIGGKFSLENCIDAQGNSVNLPATDSYYPVTIGYTGVATDPSKTVVKNKVYDIQLTIAGAGYDNENNKKGNFSLIVNVAPWSGVVTQSTVIK